MYLKSNTYNNDHLVKFREKQMANTKDTHVHKGDAENKTAIKLRGGGHVRKQPSCKAVHKKH